MLPLTGIGTLHFFYTKQSCSADKSNKDLSKNRFKVLSELEEEDETEYANPVQFNKSKRFIYKSSDRKI